MSLAAENEQLVKITTDQRAKLKETLLDPVLFSRRMLRSNMWEKQQEIMRSVLQYSRTYVKACHASGKTYMAARTVLHFLARYKEGVVITTAPTWNQVEKVLWGEIHAALGRSRYPFPKALTTELYMGPKRYAYGLSTNVTKEDEGVKFQGQHAEHVLIVLDEAPGVDPKIFGAIEGIMSAGDAHQLAIGNPTIGSGPFYDAFAHKFPCNTFTISAFDTPNLRDILPDAPIQDRLNALLTMGEVELAVMPAPYLISRKWVREMVETYGTDHFFVQTRVLGNFPTQSEDALLSLAWLERAKSLRQAEKKTGKINFGLDVAGPGEDETSLTGVEDDTGNIVEHSNFPDADPRGKVVSRLESWRGRIGMINVDSIGIGWGMYTHLRDLKFPVNAVNVGEQAKDKNKFANLKAELYWGLRMKLQAGDLGGLTDDRMIGQLAGIRYKHNPRGQVVIESKEDARKRGVKSPDRAESLMLANARNSGVAAWMGL